MTELAFTPLRIGAVELRNRLVMAPVKTAFGGTSGGVSERHVWYYRRRARGRVGLVVVEPMFVDPRGREHPGQLGAHEDRLVPGMRRLVDAVHDCGAVVFAHLNHAGRAGNPRAIGGPPEAPSAVPCPSTGATPEVMSPARIAEVLTAYGAAARRAADAGFDGVELQLGLGYLPAQFVSPRTNLREDGYSADGDGRWRFVRELVEEVRRALNPGMALTARLSADEKTSEGLSLVDAVELAQRLEAWGVDGLHVVSGSACDSPPWYYQHMALPAGINEALAAAVRDKVSVPVMVAGRLGDPARIRAVLAAGMADAVALGRPLLADPDLPLKMALGRDEEIMSCGACLQGCLAQVKTGGPIGCIVNPEVGQEETLSGAEALVPERLVVVGGGPAGMQAAVSAARRGHDVTLLESASRLGGQFTLAPATPGKQAMAKPLESLVRAVYTAGVAVRLECEATVEEILALEPDRVVVATGSRPVVPPVPGLEDPMTAAEVINGERAPGHRVLILGGGLVGLEMAELLGARGHRVVVVELLDEVARDMEPVTRKMTMRRLQDLPVAIHTSTRLTRVTGGTAFAVLQGASDEIPVGGFDSFIVAVGHRSFDPLSADLASAGVPVTVIGDAARPGQILDATRSGLAAAVGAARP